MNKIFLSLMICCCALLLLTSCGSTRFQTSNELTKVYTDIDVARFEVSVGDWLVYIVSTSFTEDSKAIKLGDHLEKIQSKWPENGSGGWSNDILNAFLRNDRKNVSVDIYNDCKDRIGNIVVPETAWDTIRKFNMMNLPMAGITYEQAMEYLDYKQGIVNSCGLNPKDKFQYKCFLPTPGQFDYIQSVLDSVNSKGCNMYNYKNSLCEDCPNGKEYMKDFILSKTGVEPTYVGGYFPYDYGVYNFKGNVAEMTSVEGIAKGGSCAHYASEAFLGNKQEYAGPAPWLGFRVWYKRIPEN